mmetsp:Transcript_99953/g.214067  ORF Transcript_99953/g.214067 Transcript_99953/m.214067 type:complete len:137 (-) Transcript_99953:251-661(-)|eukprot:CAMPEP_0180420390 /NCGR_PEP_ID=MMETSP1036_2-20121128/2608_1 /TAXON_ID=632150 /ORGANISM="Azadinium spinosum, Strain 3D9" /LENGTH=136 /DNA_ID=CAMNT_0022425617 /DNA_START=32 /DNA_END=442 /DNA_ORIENTATION=-
MPPLASWQLYCLCCPPGTRSCAFLSNTGAKRPFIWHGQQQEYDSPGGGSLGYLSVSFPPTLNKENRRILHALAALTGLECVSTGPSSMRQLSFGYDVSCSAAALLNLGDKDEMSASDICAILNANFGFTLSEDDIT